MEQQTLFEPEGNDLIRLAQARTLEEKIKDAIGLLQLHEPKDGYVLCYSGGKDSGCIKELANMADVKHRCVHKVTTLDPPELMRFIKQNHKDIIYERQPKSLLHRFIEKGNGPPTRLARWCCAEYKESGEKTSIKIVGVRAAEGVSRAANWRLVTSSKKIGTIICPIIYWTDEDVWNFHKMQNMPYCCLYDEGFKRLGCIGCPLVGSKKQTAEFERWPKYEYLWRRAFDMFWAKWKGTPTLKGKPRWFEKFNSAEELWVWWRTEGIEKTDESQCQFNFME